MGRIFVLTGSLNAFLAVVLASWGQHDLLPNPEITAKMTANFRTAVDYHFGHALGLILVGILCHLSEKETMVKVAGWTLFSGMLLFCGALYVKGAVAAPPLPEGWGIVVPAGGVLLMIGWLLLSFAALRK